MLFSGRTETVWDSLSPKWIRSFALPPETSLASKLRVSIYDRDTRSSTLEKQEKIGTAICEVWELVDNGSSGRKLQLGNSALKESGIVRLIGEVFDPSTPYHELTLGKCKFRNTSLFGKLATTRAYLTVYRRRSNNEWAPIFRSAIQRREGERTETVTRLRSGEDTPLRFELRSHRSAHEHRLIGAMHISLASLRRQGDGKKIPLGLTGVDVGEVSIASCSLGEDWSKFDLEVAFCAK